MSRELAVSVGPAARLPSGPRDAIPAIVADAGEHALRRFLEFFAANLRNEHTRRAYYRNAARFLLWCDRRGVRQLADIEPMAVAAYIEELGRELAAPSVKQQLATLRMLFDWLVTGGVLRGNPAASVRGPRHVVKTGKTPVLTAEETRQLFDAIDTADIAGQRDRAVIAVMVHALARVGAVVGLLVEDYYAEKRRAWLRLHEKGGKVHPMPCHHNLAEYLDAYIEAAGIAGDRKGPLFRTVEGKRKRLTRNPMRAGDVLRMVKRRAKKAGIKTEIGCHSFRATGITNYLEHGGTLEKAQALAGHASVRTTKLYDRTDDTITLDEVERIVF